MNEELNKIKSMAIEATNKPRSEVSVNDLDICYTTLLEIIDLISVIEYEEQTSGISEAGQQVLDTIQLCNALNREAMR